MYPCDKLIMKPRIYDTKLKSNICSFSLYVADYWAAGAGRVVSNDKIKKGNYFKVLFKALRHLDLLK